MTIDLKGLKNKQQFLDQFREHCRKINGSTRKKYLEEIRTLLNDPFWEKRYFGFDLLKNIVYGLRKDKDYYKLYDLIKNGLCDDDGRVRNNAFYAIENYRGFDIFENAEHYAHIFFDLYKSFNKSVDDKVKKSVARAIMKMDCPAFYGVMEDSDKSEEYCKILDEVEDFLGYEKTQDNV